MVSLNRMEVGKGGEKSALDEIQEEYGFKANAIVSMADVVEYLYNKECNGKLLLMIQSRQQLMNIINSMVLNS